MTFSDFKDLRIVGDFYALEILCFAHSPHGTSGPRGFHVLQMHWGCISHIDKAMTCLDFAIPF